MRAAARTPRPWGASIASWVRALAGAVQDVRAAELELETRMARMNHKMVT